VTRVWRAVPRPTAEAQTVCRGGPFTVGRIAVASHGPTTARVGVAPLSIAVDVPAQVKIGRGKGTSITKR